MENKRIPFDWEKYQSGEYEVVCRDNSIPEMITYNINAIAANKIAMWVNGHLYANRENGLLWNEGEMAHDLFLIPKQKKFQAWVNLYGDGLSVSYRTEYIAKSLIDVHVEKDREFVKTILIEWEG
jgi:hypothetical protein